MSSEMRELVQDVRNRFFWRVSPDDKRNHLIDDDAVRAVVSLCDALLARTEAGADVADTHEYTLSGVLTYGAIAIQPEQGAVPSHLRNLLRQALDYLKIELQGRDAAPVADGEKGVNNPEWPLLDRVEFALRDAGFDYDEAFRIAHLAAHPHDASALMRGQSEAVAWLVRCRRTGRVVWSDPSRSTAEGYARQIAHRMPDNTLDTEVIPLHTHPQDASAKAWDALRRIEEIGKHPEGHYAAGEHEFCGSHHAECIAIARAALAALPSPPKEREE